MKFPSKKDEIKYVIGIDEVGRGPIAGPVTLCGCIMPIELYEKKYKNFSKLLKEIQKNEEKIINLDQIRDSKKVSEKRREEIFTICSKLNKNNNVHFIVSSYTAKKIDEYGIAIAIRFAIRDILRKAQKKLNFTPKNALVLLDGSLKAPPEFIFQKTIIKGDDIEKIISCASIYAKVIRDRYMRKVAEEARKNGQIDFGFDIHKGYGTRAHMEIIKNTANKHFQQLQKNKNGTKSPSLHLSCEHRLSFMKCLTYTQIDLCISSNKIKGK